MIVLVPHREEWPIEFREIGSRLRTALGERALRIDHIGSTAVPHLAAKDIIDIQITVAAFDPAIEAALRAEGYRRVERISGDHIPPGQSKEPSDWIKWVFVEAPGARETHIHVRLAGRPNQRYPLLFRDYLRAQPSVAEAYAQIKRALAQLHPDNLDAYYRVKDPVCDIIIDAAEAWALAGGWVESQSDC